MFTTKIIRVEDKYSDKKDKPYKIIWFANESGLPCKVFGDSKFSGVAGDSIKVSIQPGYNCDARVEIVKA